MARAIAYSRMFALVQLLALLILQGYFLLPVCRQIYFGHAQPVVCQKDHSRCGCAPERIVAKSCCCFRPVQSCCPYDHPEDEHICDTRKNSDARLTLSSAPCGNETEYSVVSLDKLKFITPQLTFPTAHLADAEYHRIPCPGIKDRSIAPPDPPPEADNTYYGNTLQV